MPHETVLEPPQPPAAPPKTETELVLEAEAQFPAPDTGDDVWVVYWRLTSFPAVGDGDWQVASTRVIACGANGIVAHEVTNPTTAATDGTGVHGSLTRWSESSRIFRTRAAAEHSARQRPRPQ